jgi:hypothetical protein
MHAPAERFHASVGSSTPPGPPLLVADELQVTARPATSPRPGGPGQIARLVHSNGVIVVARLVCSVGRRYAGKQVTVQVEPSVLHIFCDGVYVKTIRRTTSLEVTQVRAHRRNSRGPVR